MHQKTIAINRYIDKNTTKMARVLNFTQFINEAEDQKKIEYIYDKAGKEVEKAILNLEGSDSAQMTKLMNKFVETYELLKQAQESHDEVKDVLKDKINESFTEELKFVTRIINTVKYAFTFSKYTKAKEETSEVVDYKAAMNEMMEIFPDIKDGLKEIIKKHTEIKKVVKKEISGSIKYTHVTLNEGLSDILKGLITKLEGIFSSLYRSLKTIGGRIDDKFEKIDSLLKG
jgi:hypothetical protein